LKIRRKKDVIISLQGGKRKKEKSPMPVEEKKRQDLLRVIRKKKLYSVGKKKKKGKEKRGFPHRCDPTSKRGRATSLSYKKGGEGGKLLPATMEKGCTRPEGKPEKKKRKKESANL